MDEDSSSKKLLAVKDQDEKPSTPSGQVRSSVLYFSALGLASLLMVAQIIVGLLSTLSNADDFGFKNSTANISDEYPTQITPAGWTFGIWGLIYIWQILWLTYAWSFAIRSTQPRTIPWTTCALHAIGSACTIIWTYIWGNDYPQVSFPVIVLIALSMFLAEGFAAVYLYGLSSKISKMEKVLANVLVINGIGIYCTWQAFASLANLAVVLQYFAGVDAVTTGTAMLSVLSAEVLAYFALEMACLDKYLRYLFIVYPVLIFSLAGVLAAHWGDEDRQNPIFALVLEVVVCLLFIPSTVSSIIFHFFRPISSPKKADGLHVM